MNKLYSTCPMYDVKVIIQFNGLKHLFSYLPFLLFDFIRLISYQVQLWNLVNICLLFINSDNANVPNIQYFYLNSSHNVSKKIYETVYLGFFSRVFNFRFFHSSKRNAKIWPCVNLPLYFKIYQKDVVHYTANCGVLCVVKLIKWMNILN